MHLWSGISERLLKMSVWVKKTQMQTKTLECNKSCHRNHKYKQKDMVFIHERYSEKKDFQISCDENTPDLFFL